MWPKESSFSIPKIRQLILLVTLLLWAVQYCYFVTDRAAAVIVPTWTQEAETAGISRSLATDAADLEHESMLPERHILLSMSSNHTGLFAEYEVALKSILLNAPIDNPISIHILADQAAFDKLQSAMNDIAPFEAWTTRNPTKIKVYNVQTMEETWKDQIQSHTARAVQFTKNRHRNIFRHTIGTYYRTFAWDVLPPEVDSVVYMDTDTVVMSDLGELWTEGIWDPSKLFQWGENHCAAFLMLNFQETDTIWSLFDQLSNDMLEKMAGMWNRVDDQFVLRAIDHAFPDKVGSLPPRWDVTAMNGPWTRDPNKLYEKRQDGVGFLHFNGGGESKQAFFVQGHKHYETGLWNLAKYYVDMPWSWAQQTIKSRIRFGHAGYPLVLQFIEVAGHKEISS